MNKFILEKLGLSEAATEEEILAAIAALQEGDAKAQVLAGEVDLLRTDAEIARAAADAAAKAAVEGAIKAGRLPPKNTALAAQWEATLRPTRPRSPC